MKIVKSLEESSLLIKGVSETVKNEAKEQKGGFLMLHHLLNNFEIPKCYQNKHRLIEIYSGDNLTKIKDKALTGLNSFFFFYF